MPTHDKPIFPDAPKGEKADYSSVPWELVRFDYENTPISVRLLAEKYGIKWEASIRQRILRRGWKRNIEAIASGVTDKGVALGARGVSDRELTTGNREHAEEASDVEASLSLARKRLNQVDAELEVGDKLLALAMNMVTCLSIITAEDSQTDEVASASVRMNRINPEKETLASLAKTAAVVAEAAILIKRRAFGMQTSNIRVLSESKPQTEDNAVKSGLTLLQRLPPQVLTDLRIAAVELSRRSGR